MEVKTTALEGVLIIKPDVFGDARGYFMESFNARAFAGATLMQPSFVQDNESRSSYGVLRGLHYQREPYSQGKLVRCVEGSVLDVVVDIRHGSPTFGRHVAVELSGENHLQMFIPRGFAHGFSVLSESALFQYKCDRFYRPASEAGISALDPALGIDWRIPAEAMILSGKDLGSPRLCDAPVDFRYGEPLYTLSDDSCHE